MLNQRKVKRSSARWQRRLKARGGLAILRSSLAPDGCVIKISGSDQGKHIGPARVFDGEDAAFEAVQNGAINDGDVIIIRNEVHAVALACVRCWR